MFSSHIYVLENLLNDKKILNKIVKSGHVLCEKRSFIIQITKTEKHREHWILKTKLELKSNKYLVINLWNRPYKFIGACMEVTWESLRESIL